MSSLFVFLLLVEVCCCVLCSFIVCFVVVCCLLYVGGVLLLFVVVQVVCGSTLFVVVCDFNCRDSCVFVAWLVVACFDALLLMCLLCVVVGVGCLFIVCLVMEYC